MNKRMGWQKKILWLIVSLILGIQIIPLRVHAGELQSKQTTEADLRAIVEPQIRAYADSIAQKDADTNAATILANHGLRGNGKKLTMNAKSPMAATLLNSEVVQEGLSVFFADTIQTMQQLDMKSVPGVEMNFGWYGSKNFYKAYILTESNESPDNLDWMMVDADFAGELNSYDDSLEWMVGNCDTNISLKCIEENEFEEKYKITVTFNDNFDFSIANTAGFKKLLSGVGMLLFKEYDWACTVTFYITVPQTYGTCSHNSGAYHWTYDAEANMIISDSSENYLQNNTTHYSDTKEDGTIHHYYELDRTVRLYHDEPWVLEYDVCNPEKIVLAPVGNAVTKTYPQLTHKTMKSVYLISKEYTMAENADGNLDRYYAYNYYGTKLQDIYKFSSGKTYTFRYENVIAEDGSNKIYLDVLETDTGAYCLSRIALDDYYYYGGWMAETELISEENNWLSGRDILIRYFGTEIEGFRAGTFDLRIWENGKDAQTESFLSSKTVSPTCTEKGYTIHTCTACAYNYQDTYTDALGHAFGEWSISKEPTCAKTGEKQRKCSNCSFVEKEEIEVLEHEYTKTTILPTCESLGFTRYQCAACGYGYEADYQDAKGHIWNEGVISKSATCTETGIKIYTCTTCKSEKEETIEKKPHNYKYATCTKPKTCRVCEATSGKALGHKYEKYYTVDRKATLNAKGSKSKHCSRCDIKGKAVAIEKIQSVRLSAVKFTYTGKAHTPVIRIKDSKGNTISSANYTVTGVKSAKNVGKYTIKITFKGGYGGSKILNYTVYPKAPDTLTAKLYGYNDVQLQWTKVTGAKGYNIYVKKGSETYEKVKEITSAATVTYKKANLADGAEYTFKVVPYFGKNKTEGINSKTVMVTTLKKVSTPTVIRRSAGEVKVSWKNIAGESGYEISYSENKAKKGTIWTCGGSSQKSKILTVKKGKTYYYKVRAYKVVDNKKIYGPWSEIKNFKLK